MKRRKAREWWLHVSGYAGTWFCNGKCATRVCVRVREVLPKAARRREGEEVIFQKTRLWCVPCQTHSRHDRVQGTGEVFHHRFLWNCSTCGLPLRREEANGFQDTCRMCLRHWDEEIEYLELMFLLANRISGRLRQ